MSASPQTDRRRVPWLLFLPTALLYFTFFILPLGTLGVISFWHQVPGAAAIPGFSMENYVKFLTDSYYLGMLWRTLVVALITSALALLLGYPLAYGISRAPSRYRALLMIGVILPLMTSAVVRSFGWMVLLTKQGLFTKLFGFFGIQGGPSGLMFTTTGLVIAMTHVFLPYMVFVLYGVLDRIPLNLEEAAGNLGASRWGAFIHVVFPMSMSGVAAGTLLVFTMTLSSFVTPMLVGGPRVKVVATEIFDQAINLLNWPFAGAMAIFLMVLIVSISAVYNRLMDRTAEGGPM